MQLRPPTDDHPASMLRWARQVHVLPIGVGLLLALQMRIHGMHAWWIGLLAAGIGLIAFATSGPAIRRAERRGPNDPATLPARRSRATRIVSSYTIAVVTIAFCVGLCLKGLVAAIVVAAIAAASLGLGLWLFSRWTQS